MEILSLFLPTYFNVTKSENYFDHNFIYTAVFYYLYASQFHFVHPHYDVNMISLLSFQIHTFSCGYEVMSCQYLNLLIYRLFNVFEVKLHVSRCTV